MTSASFEDALLSHNPQTDKKRAAVMENLYYLPRTISLDRNWRLDLLALTGAKVKLFEGGSGGSLGGRGQSLSARARASRIPLSLGAFSERARSVLTLYVYSSSTAAQLTRKPAAAISVARRFCIMERERENERERRRRRRNKV
jgi:hypothetical protein